MPDLNHNENQRLVLDLVKNSVDTLANAASFAKSHTESTGRISTGWQSPPDECIVQFTIIRPLEEVGNCPQGRGYEI